MLWSGDLTDEARAMYENFDCAKAVTLIGFLGLLSNFQDTIDGFTDLLNNGGRRRRSDGPTEGWKDMLYSALEAFGYETESFQPMSETGRSGHLIQEKNVDQSDYGQTYNAVLKDTLQDTSDWTEQPHRESKRDLLQDLAHTGPVLAMWLVDTGDGRVSGEEGRAGVCRASQSFTNTHGWLGSIAVRLLLNTLAAALSEHQDSKELLDRAGLSAGTVVC